MAKENDVPTYEQLVAKLEQLVHDLENAEAMPMGVYRKKAQEGKRLLEQCRAKLAEY